jgi:tRNA U34 5-carboxymethylaminomethyl modifying GTPase MnmE/TrmE
VAAVRRGCVELLAELEARLDFDEDLPQLDQQRLQQQVGGGRWLAAHARCRQLQPRAVAGTLARAPRRQG